tara:strand:- start:373 stop:474 length:102 start_codon:yes stop_codon:yes gene_type:complete
MADNIEDFLLMRLTIALLPFEHGEREIRLNLGS